MVQTIQDAADEDLDWLKYNDEQARKLGEYFITSAEKYGDIFTAINTIYVALLTFFGLTSNGVLAGIAFPWSLVFLLPVIAWIGGMFYFIQVKRPYFTSYNPDSPSEIRRALTESNIIKGEYFQKGILCFGIGVLLIIVPLVAGMYIQSIPSEKTQAYDVQLVIAGDQVQYLRQIPIEFDPGTNRTQKVSMQDASGLDYVVKTPDGSVAAINKTWVKVVVKK